MFLEKLIEYIWGVKKGQLIKSLMIKILLKKMNLVVVNKIYLMIMNKLFLLYYNNMCIDCCKILY